jgi:SAM-dependent methyltransferase
MIVPSEKPLGIVNVHDDPSKKVFVYSKGPNDADSFGYEWTEYPKTYSDAALNSDLSKTRLELNLGFPLSFLKGMNVLEIGCGAGRFTEHLIRHARNVVAVDLSDAVYCNSALGAPNLLAMRADLHDIPSLSETIDLVFCRGVIQHTADPKKSLHRLFDHVRKDGFVIFDVYKKNRGHKWTTKYFFRPILQKHVPIETFNRFINRRSQKLYDLHHRLLRFWSYFGPLRKYVSRTPFFLTLDMNWESQYGNLTREQREEIFKNELVDAMYAKYDQPMSTEEVIEALAEIGQTPYSYDVLRNHFRCRKSDRPEPLAVQITKNGIFF